jgi:hypothetical protein
VQDEVLEEAEEGVHVSLHELGVVLDHDNEDLAHVPHTFELLAEFLLVGPVGGRAAGGHKVQDFNKVLLDVIADTLGARVLRVAPADNGKFAELTTKFEGVAAEGFDLLVLAGRMANVRVP